MHVDFVRIIDKEGSNRVKCFYKHKGKYGEFFVEIDWQKGRITFESKDPTYAAALVQAFAAAMVKM